MQVTLIFVTLGFNMQIIKFLKPLKRLFLLFLIISMPLKAENLQHKTIQVLIIDGQNNHQVWPKATMMFKEILTSTQRFHVDIARTHYIWKAEKHIEQFPLNDGKKYTLSDPKTDPHFSPKFEKYDVVISNFGWRAASWPKATQENFERYIANGGGFVSVHAADNSFPKWQAYNKMIGLGGWGKRNQKDGPYVYYNELDQLTFDHANGGAGGHGKQHAFAIDIRDKNHPITQDLPTQWMHTKDELYNRLRGPAENLNILATAYDDKAFGGSGRHEPVLMTIHYGKGRIFHTTLGHDTQAIESVGFITTLQRGTEWAATGKVTQKIPVDFPDEKQSRKRKLIKATTSIQ